VLRRSRRRAGLSPLVQAEFDAGSAEAQYWLIRQAAQPQGQEIDFNAMVDYMAAQEETTGDQELILNDNNDEDSVYIAALGDYLEDDAARTREEEQRAARLRVIVAQEQEQIPLLERDCAICLEPLQEEANGPPMSLPCHITHCFHAGCLARHLALARNPVEGRCPICRATGCPHVQINAAPGWHAARRAEEQRVAQDWQASGEWDELPPCQAPQMPAPQPMPAPPAQQVVGECLHGPHDEEIAPPHR